MYTTNNAVIDSYKTFEALLTRYIVPSRSEQADLANHGADSGYALLSYYADVEAIYERFEDEICDAVEDANGLSLPSAFAIYAKRKHMSGTLGDYLYFLVWCAAEIICARVCDAETEYEDEPLGIIMGRLDEEHEARMVEITKYLREGEV